MALELTFEEQVLAVLRKNPRILFELMEEHFSLEMDHRSGNDFESEQLTVKLKFKDPEDHSSETVLEQFVYL